MTNTPITDDDLLRQIEAAETTMAVCDRNIKRAKHFSTRPNDGSNAMAWKSLSAVQKKSKHC